MHIIKIVKIVKISQIKWGNTIVDNKKFLWPFSGGDAAVPDL